MTKEWRNNGTWSAGQTACHKRRRMEGQGGWLVVGWIGDSNSWCDRGRTETPSGCRRYMSAEVMDVFTCYISFVFRPELFVSTRNANQACWFHSLRLQLTTATFKFLRNCTGVALQTALELLSLTCYYLISFRCTFLRRKPPKPDDWFPN